MYEILLKWGLDSVRNLLVHESEQSLTLTVEAVKTKNLLVAKRFDYSWSACETLIDLSLDIENSLRELQNSWRSDSENPASVKPFLLVMQEDFHPPFFHRYKRIRNKFEGTNDLLAAYSIVFTRLIQFKQFTSLCNDRGFTKPADVSSVYRALWNHVASLHCALLRVSSNDLRFWLADRSYVKQAESFAVKELDTSIAYYKGTTRSARYNFMLEDPEQADRFWRDLDDSA